MVFDFTPLMNDPAAWAALVSLVVMEIVRGRSLEVYDGPHGHPDAEPGHAPRGPLPRRF